MTAPPPPYSPQLRQPLDSRDFDTASVRSAAPSYVSRAPTYVSTIPSSSAFWGAGAFSSPTGSSSRQSRPRDEPSLNAFTGRNWSITTPNPNARQYHSVAHRRATAASAQEQHQLLAATLTPNGLQGLEEQREGEEKKKLRPLEDPELVGEEAAEIARKARLAKEGHEILVQEDQGWDWMLSQMKDWEKREHNWQIFRKEAEMGKAQKLAKSLGSRK